MSNKLVERVAQIAHKNKLEDLLLEAPLVVGVSGGADSLALLNILCALRGDTARQSLHVAHLDHGFRGTEGEADALFVICIAEAWGLPCTVQHFDVPAYARKHKLSDEDAARQVRYAFLAEVASEKQSTVAVAHNSDDQVETVLMNLLRGAGVSGLVGMKPLNVIDVAEIEPGVGRPDFDGQRQNSGRKVSIFRPLLSSSRSEIEEYCREQGLKPLEDATNAQQRYRRNRIRHELVPYLQSQYSPAVKQHILTLSAIASAEDALIEEMVEQAWDDVVQKKGPDLLTFDIGKTMKLKMALRRRLARLGIKVVAGTLDGFNFGHIESVARILAGSGRSISHIDLPHGVEAGREGSVVWLGKSGAAARVMADVSVNRQAVPCMNSDLVREVHAGDTLALGTGWLLKCSLVALQHVENVPGERVALFDMGQLQTLGQPVVRTRRAGDTIQPMGMQGRKSLQDLLVDAKIPRRLREQVPVVALAPSGGEVLWVPGEGGRRSRHAPIGPGTTHILVLETVWGEDSGGSENDARA